MFWLPLPCEVTVPSHHWKSQFLGWHGLAGLLTLSKSNTCSQVMAPFPKALGREVRG